MTIMRDCGPYRSLADHIKTLHPNYAQSGSKVIETGEDAPFLSTSEETVEQKVEDKNIKMPKTDPRVGVYDKPVKVSDDVFNIFERRILFRKLFSPVLWYYVRVNKLQDPTDKQYFTVLL